MKRFFNLLLATMLIMTCFVIPNRIYALESENNCFVVTEDNENFDTYVRENIHYFLQLEAYEAESVVYKGIKIFNSSDEQYLYPVAVDETIVASFLVTYKNNQFYCDYSKSMNYALNLYASLSSDVYPLYIYRNNNGEMCYKVNTAVFNTYTQVETNESDALTFVENNIKDFRDEFVYTKLYSKSKSITSYYVWNNYYIGSPDTLRCGPITLYNIYRNLPYSHTMTTYDAFSRHISNVYHNATGKMFPSLMVNYSDMKIILDNDDYYTRYYSSSGYMKEPQISETILNHHRYIMAFLKTTTGAGHIAGIVGETVNNTNVIYYVFDPHSGIHTTTDAGFSLTSNGITYYWTGGYLGDFY